MRNWRGNCKALKKGAKPMGQDGRADHKTNNIAAQAAPAIVNCQLSIVNFLGFASDSGVLSVQLSDCGSI
jgi:hypothetical protein